MKAAVFSDNTSPSRSVPSETKGSAHSLEGAAAATGASPVGQQALAQEMTSSEMRKSFLRSPSPRRYEDANGGADWYFPQSTRRRIEGSSDGSRTVSDANRYLRRQKGKQKYLMRFAASKKKSTFSSRNSSVGSLQADPIPALFLEVLQKTSLSEMRAKDLIEWLTETSYWLRDVKCTLSMVRSSHVADDTDFDTPESFFHFKRLTRELNDTPSSEVDQVYLKKLVFLHFRLIHVLRTMPWWRLIDFDALDSIVSATQMGHQRPPMLPFVSSGDIFEGVSGGPCSPAPASRDKNEVGGADSRVPVSSIFSNNPWSLFSVFPYEASHFTTKFFSPFCSMRASMTRWQYDVQLALEQLSMACLAPYRSSRGTTFSVGIVKGVAEIWMRVFSLHLPARDSTPRLTPADSIARILSSIVELLHQTSPPEPARVAFLGGTSSKSQQNSPVQKILTQCIHEWIPKIKWPVVQHHAEAFTIFLLLALEETLPNPICAKSTTLKEEGEDVFQTRSEPLGVGEHGNLKFPPYCNTKTLMSAYSALHEMFYSTDAVASFFDYSSLWRSQDGTSPTVVNHLFTHGSFILELLFERLTLMELSLESKATPTLSASSGPSTAEKVGGVGGTIPVSIQSPCYLPGQVFSAHANSPAMGALKNSGHFPLQSSSENTSEAFGSHRSMRPRQQPTSEAIRRMTLFFTTSTEKSTEDDSGCSQLPNGMLNHFSNTSFPTFRCIEACSVLMYVRLQQDILKTAWRSQPQLEKEQNEGNEEESGMLPPSTATLASQDRLPTSSLHYGTSRTPYAFPFWWNLLVHFYVDALRLSKGPAFSAHLLPSLLKVYAEADRLIQRHQGGSVAQPSPTRRRFAYEESLNVMHRLVSLVLTGSFVASGVALKGGSYAAGILGEVSVFSSTVQRSNFAGPTLMRMGRGPGKPAANLSTAPSLPITERIRLAHYLFPLFRRLSIHHLHAKQERERRKKYYAERDKGSSGESNFSNLGKTSAEVLLRRIIKWCRQRLSQDITPLSSGTPRNTTSHGRELTVVVWAQAVAIASLMDATAQGSQDSSGKSVSPVPEKSLGDVSADDPFDSPLRWQMMEALWKDSLLSSLMQHYRLEYPPEKSTEAMASASSTPWRVSLDFQQMEEDGLIRLKLLDVCPWREVKLT